MDIPVNVPIDDPNADTEWNDILRKHGIIPEKPPSPTPLIEAALLSAQARAHSNRLEDKDLDELAELEDEEDEEFLNQYRKKRMEELSTITKKSVHGQVYHLRKPDYTRDVTEASRSGYVLVHLTSSSSSNVESRLLTERWRELASVFGDVKFCEIQGDMCIEGYPEKNCPTILVYRDGEIVRQLLTLRELNGPRTTQADLGNLLVGVGAVKADDVRVIRLRRGHDDAKMRAEAEKEDESDNDWD